jgi:hypothetical protein
MMQLVFNIAALGVSTSAATIIHALAGACGLGPVPALLLTAVGYYAINALVVTGVLALLHAQTVRRLWVAWMRWTTPAFLVSGAAAAGLFVIDPLFHGSAAMLLIPAVILFQLWYRRVLSRISGVAA